MQLPEGTLTFLFTDIAGSTRLWEAHPEAMRRVLARHDDLLRTAVENAGGMIFKHTGDGVAAVFRHPSAAVRAAMEGRCALEAESWGPVPELRTRMAIHTGDSQLRAGDYYGSTLNRCARMLAAAHGGQLICSQATAHLTRDALPPGTTLIDLGVHRLRDLSRAERVYELRHAEQAERFPPLRSLDAYRHNLPRPRTTFIGRKRETADVRALLESTRLVTLVGIGGVGKTRLALQVATDALPRYADGVVLVELASVTDELVVEAIAAAVGAERSAMRDGASRIDDVVRALADRHVLLLLDNCEHVVATCARVVHRLIADCRALTILATSRESLRIAGEHRWPVPPLTFHAAIPDTADDDAGEAVKLFVERAAAADPGFSLTRTNAGAVRQICAELGGIPLALELAAARIRHLTAHEIRDRLRDQLRLLGGTARDAEARQHTLRATMDWSYNLLRPDERRLLNRLAVFVDGFTIEAAEAICEGGGIAADQILDALGSLADKSLLDVDTGGATARYRMLEIVRQYAAAQLGAGGEEDEVRERHRRWFAAYTERVTLRPYGSLSQRSAAVLWSESENLRAALDRSLLQNAGGDALRMAARVWGCWIARRRFDDAASWLARVLGHATAASGEDDLAIILGMAHIHLWTGDFAAVCDWTGRLLDLAAARGVSAVVPAAQNMRAVAFYATRSGDPEGLLLKTIDDADRLGDVTASGEARWLLGDARMGAGDYRGAAALLDGALDLLAREPTNGSTRAHCLISHAVCAHLVGDHVRALDAGRRAVEVASTPEGRYGYPTADLLPKATTHLALALAATGQAKEAGRHLRNGLRETQRFALPLGEADCVVAFGAVAMLLGHPETAARLLGAARTLMSAHGAWRRITGGVLYRHYVAQVRAALAPEVAERARNEGRAMGRDEAIAYAFAFADSIS